MPSVWQQWLLYWFTLIDHCQFLRDNALRIYLIWNVSRKIQKAWYFFKLWKQRFFECIIYYRSYSECIHFSKFSFKRRCIFFKWTNRMSYLGYKDLQTIMHVFSSFHLISIFSLCEKMLIWWKNLMLFWTFLYRV